MGKLKAIAGHALICAIIGESEQAADAIAQIVEMGPWAVHGALCGWSGLSLHGFADGQPIASSAAGFWTTMVTDERTGNATSIDRVGDPALRDAFQLVSCFGNDDHETIAAIVRTNMDDGPEALAALMTQSLRIAAEMAKHLRRLRDSQ
jgi:hypothetical protein